MGKSSPPEPPDPRETSAASTSTNVGTAIANAINDAGVIVGTAGTAFSSGFAWSLADGLVDLNDRLDPVSGGGWSILQATGISESGLIVGRAYSSTLGYRAVLLSPVPEPATVLLWMAGLAGLALWVRQRQRPVRLCLRAPPATV